MRALTLAPILVGLLALGLPVKAHAIVPNAGLPRSCEGRSAANVGTVYFPEAQPPQPGPAPARPRQVRIGIDSAGAFRFEGVPISTAALNTRLTSELGRGPVEIGLVPARRAPVHAVVEVLRELNARKLCSFVVIGAEQYSDVFNHRELAAGRFEIPPLAPFAKVTDALLYVDYRPSAPTTKGKRKPGETGCRAYFNAAETNSAGLTEGLFKRLKTVVSIWWSVGNDPQRTEIFPPGLYGGTEISGETASKEGMAPPDIFMNAAIYAKGTTPWSCVAGAVYAAQVSGFANADLILSP